MVTEQFTRIIEKQKDEPLLDFLRTITPQDRKQLAPLVKKMEKEYHQFAQLKGGSYGYPKGSDIQREMLLLAAFVCLNRKDFERTTRSVWIVERKHLSRIIDWHCPDWFSDFVNGQAEQDFVPSYFDYVWLMELAEKGLLRPSGQLIVKILPPVIFEFLGGHNWGYNPAPLLWLPVTLQEHIWYFFEIESTIHSAERYVHFASPDTERVGWIKAFKEFSDRQKIDRFRVLQESLLAGNRNFNKSLSGWFAELFATLEPTDEELLRLQKELLSALSSPHSKPVNTALKGIRKIATDKTFDVEGLLDASPLLLASDTKATVNATLMVLEKLAQKHPALRQRITKLTCQTFIHSEEELQTRAAKLIAKSGDVADEAIRAEMAQFRPNMLASTLNVLAGFLPAEEETTFAGNDLAPQDATGHSPAETTSLQETIPFPNNIDDLAFLASQAFDNNESWHLDILAAALVQFAPFLKDKDVPLFEPAFKRALNGPLGSNSGTLDHLLGMFFIDFGKWLIGKFGRGAGTSIWLTPTAGVHLATWGHPSKLSIYQPFKHLLLEVQDMIGQGQQLPVLSTPTHKPCWIDPKVLITRLSSYQQAGKPPANMDLQIAVSRCSLADTREALKMAEQQLTGECKALMIFLLSEPASPVGPFHLKPAWLVAALTRKDQKSWPEFGEFAPDQKTMDHDTGRVQWRSQVVSFIEKRYDYQTRKNVASPATRKELTVDRVQQQRTSGSFMRRLAFWRGSKDRAESPFLYSFLQFRIQYSFAEHNDIVRVLSLVPNNPDPLLADTINKCLQDPSFSGESDKRMVSSVEQFLYSTWRSPGPMTNLFLATCMISGDKTVAGTAGEIWLQAVSRGQIDNRILGSIIGQHESIEFAPLKRFTDLITQHLMKVSPHHDKQLKILIEQIILLLPAEPIKNLKKLLEIYSELVAIGRSAEKPEGLLAKLTVWEKNTGLQRLILQLKTNN